MKYGRPIAKCEPCIHRATEGPTMDGPFGDQYKFYCKNKAEWKWTDDSFFLAMVWTMFYHTSWEAMIKPYHRPLLHEDTNNGQYSEISILVTVLQLSGHPVAKCNLWNDRATQILPNTGPTGNPRIPFAKVHVVPDDAAMLDVWLSNYAYFFQYFYVGPPKICVEHPTYTINWVVLWVTQDSSLAAALILVIFNWFHGLSRSLIDGRPRTDADHQTTTMGSPMDDSGFWHFLQHWSGDP